MNATITKGLITAKESNYEFTEPVLIMYFDGHNGATLCHSQQFFFAYSQVIELNEVDANWEQ